MDVSFTEIWETRREAGLKRRRGQTINSCWCMLKYSLWRKKKIRDVVSLPLQLDGEKAISLHISLDPCREYDSFCSNQGYQHDLIVLETLIF